MLLSIYEDQHRFAEVEKQMPKEVEEMYVIAHGEEPEAHHIVILPKLSRK